MPSGELLYIRKYDSGSEHTPSEFSIPICIDGVGTSNPLRSMADRTKQRQ